MIPGYLAAMTPQTRPRISAIIPTYNRPDFLRRVLLSFASQTRLVDEVIVTDDGSSADVPGGIADVLPGLPFPVAFVTHRHEGFQLAKCRNNGIRAATGEYLLFVDQDIVLAPTYVDTFARSARPGEFQVGYPVRLDAAVTERVNDDLIRSGGIGTLVPAAGARKVRRQAKEEARYAFLHRVGLRPIGAKLRGGVMGAWRADLLAVNGYDERYVGWGNEDDDLGRRLHRAGIPGRNVLSEPLAIHMYHPPHHQMGARANQGYYAQRVRAIRAGDVRATEGVEIPDGRQVPKPSWIHTPAPERRTRRPAPAAGPNLGAGRFLVPTWLEHSPYSGRIIRVLEQVAARLGAELWFRDDVREEDLPPDCPFVMPFRPVQWSHADGFAGLLTLPARIQVLGVWDDVHQGMRGSHRFHRDRRILLRHFDRADVIVSFNRTPFLQWYPEHARKLVHVPMFYSEADFADIRFNPAPLPQCILSGSLGKFYPFRKAAARHPGVVVLPHPGYSEASRPGGPGTFGADYARELSRYVCGVTCGSVVGYVVAKYMEIPAAGCLLLAPHLPDLDLLGYEDGVNYIQVNDATFGAVLADVLARPQAYESIRRAGYDMVRARHTDAQRVDQLEALIRGRCAPPTAGPGPGD